MTNKSELKAFNGLWIIEFISTLKREGKGVITLSNGRLSGGDSGYYYTGDYDINDGKIIGNIIAIKHNPNWESVFGNIDSFKLSFFGEVNSDHFSAIGSVVGMPQYKISIIGKRKQDL